MGPASVAQIPEDERQRLRREALAGCERTLAPGERLFAAGDSGRSVFVVRSGEIELTRRGPSGPCVVGRLGPGEPFGEQAVPLGGRRATNATALSEARVLELDAATFDAMCRARPDIAVRWIGALAARLDDLEEFVAARAGDDANSSLVQALLRLAQPAEEGARIPGSLRSLAEAAGLSLLETYRALHPLLERRLLRLVDDVLQAPDLDALARGLPSEA
ncbi:MAG TPA: Crp/Fnr family transcriptional regulator [Myxococcota bacterium]|nr:Crp/Fnr family transcriptional regulator [Myxococcota bacterium]